MLQHKLDHVYTPCSRGGKILELITPPHKMGEGNCGTFPRAGDMEDRLHKQQICIVQDPSGETLPKIREPVRILPTLYIFLIICLCYIVCLYQFSAILANLKHIICLEFINPYYFI